MEPPKTRTNDLISHQAYSHMITTKHNNNMHSRLSFTMSTVEKMRYPVVTREQPFEEGTIIMRIELLT